MDGERIRRLVEESHRRQDRAVDAYRTLLTEDRLDAARLVRFVCGEGCSVLEVFAIADAELILLVPAEYSDDGEVLRSAYVCARDAAMNPPARCAHRGEQFMADAVLDAAVTRAVVHGPSVEVLP